VTDRAGVRLATSRYTTDVANFDDLLKRAGEADDSSRERPALLIAAIDSYGGPLLPGFDDVWALSERHRLEDAYLGALRALPRWRFARPALKDTRPRKGRCLPTGLPNADQPLGHLYVHPPADFMWPSSSRDAPARPNSYPLTITAS